MAEATPYIVDEKNMKMPNREIGLNSLSKLSVSLHFITCKQLTACELAG